MVSDSGPFVRASYPPAPFAATFLVAAASTDERASPRVAAALIDPGFFHPSLIELVERNGLEIAAVLITRDHPAHTHSLGTVMRAYQAQVYAGSELVAGLPATRISGGGRIDVGGMELEAIALPGEAEGALAFLLDDLLFSGYVLSAGEVAATTSAGAAQRQQRALRDRIATLPSTTRILPAHGPPTTVGLELAFNPALKERPLPHATSGTDRERER